MPDLEILCPMCQQPFVFTEAEQAACAEQAFPPPTYCPTCHRQRKAEKDDARQRTHRGSRRHRR